MGGLAGKLKPIQVSGTTRYSKIRSVDGSHPFKDKCPLSYVCYPVRERKGGQVAYFNFDLAKEMGLIPADHPDSLNADLKKALLQSFAIVIVNEYDIQHGLHQNDKTIRKNHYMATRYLQLQHPNRLGITSGDGRSIWNGVVTHKGRTWDVTSRGTGATCLSPATAIHGRFFRTGDPHVSYGCGYSTVNEGITDVLFSESLSLNAVGTERVLCIIEFAGGYGITVRAGLNLIRPSHFFNHLKQNRLDRLKAVTDYFIDRQVNNRVWSQPPTGSARYDFFLDRISETFAHIAAQYEAMYIFCWLDWDGDNILADGGIVDFGSVRQFGLFHHEYRFDDDARWSTNIKEQRIKARYIVQNFAQIVDFIKTGQKRPLKDFADHAALRAFDRHFEAEKRRFLLFHAGFDAASADLMLRERLTMVKKYERIFSYFERAKSEKGPVKVPDGITWYAKYAMRDLMRNLTSRYARSWEKVAPMDFYRMMASSFAPKLKSIPPALARKIDAFQTQYMALVAFAAKRAGMSPVEYMRAIAARAAVINQPDRITGDAVCHIAERINGKRRHLTKTQLYRLTKTFSQGQILIPERKANPESPLPSGEVANLMKTAVRLLRMCREGL